MLLEECRLVSETASGRRASELRDSEEKGRRAEIASGGLAVVTQQEKGEASRYWPVTEFSPRREEVAECRTNNSDPAHRATVLLSKG